MAKYCEWKYDKDTESWNTGCGNKHQFLDGTPKENTYIYCPYCGAKINYNEEKTCLMN